MNLTDVIGLRSILVGRSFTTKARQAAFDVLQISERGIIVGVGSSNRERHISPAEVNLMGECWKEYQAGTVTRSELANGNPPIFNTSYLEVIFGEMEGR